MSDAFTIRSTGASFVLFEAIVRASLLPANKHGPFEARSDPNGLRQGDLKVRTGVNHSAHDRGRTSLSDDHWTDRQGHIDGRSEFTAPLAKRSKNEVDTDE